MRSARSALLVLTGCTLVLRWWFPTEVASHGETGWIACLWLGLAASWLWQCRTVTTPDRWDAAVGLLCAGHIMSGLWIFLVGGSDVRAALHLLAEWSGLAATWWVVRHLTLTTNGRVALVRIVQATLITLAVLAIWQRFVAFPALVRDYGPLLTESRAILNTPPATRTLADTQRLADFNQRLSDLGLPLEDPARQMFERRLLDSQEPYGPFALANTLAAFLAVGVVWQLLGLRLTKQWPTVVTVLLLVLALVLTKSRTAWMGTACGAAVVGWWSLFAQARMGPVSARSLAGAGLVLLVFTGLAFSLLDREVLFEAPKSLAYRAEYWQATLRLLAHHQWLGVGLGGFRDEYLQFKLPASSEEIADPHNAFLDVWCHGGWLALAGLVWLTWELAQQCVRRPIAPASSLATQQEVPLNLGTPLDLGAALWLPLVGIAGPFVGLGLQDDRFVLGLVWAAAWWAVRSTAIVTPAWPAAATLGVHLLGAGGGGMPAVIQLLLALIAVSAPAAAREHAWLPTRSQRAAYTAIPLLVLLFLLMTSVGPRSSVLHHTAEIMQFWKQGRWDAALAACDRAIAADRWDAEPHRLKAETLLQRLPLAPPPSLAAIKDIVTELERARTLRPASPAWDERLSQVYALGSPHDAELNLRAAKAAQRATTLAPTSVQLWKQRAMAEDRAGQSAAAQQSAKTALQLDDINHQRGHQERYLTTDERDHMQRLAP